MPLVAIVGDKIEIQVAEATARGTPAGSYHRKRLSPDEAQPIIVEIGRQIGAGQEPVVVDIGEVGTGIGCSTIHLCLKLTRLSAEAIRAQLVTAGATLFFRQHMPPSEN